MRDPSRTRWIESSRSHPCPVCDRAGWCRVSEDGKTAHCHCVESPRPWRYSGGGWLHILDGSTARPTPPPPPAAPKADPLPVELHNRIARALLDLLRVSDGHKRDLARRGLDTEAIARHGYKSWPRWGRTDLVRRLLDLGLRPEDLARFPGYIVKEGRFGPYATLAGAEGLLVPVLNIDGLIIGFQLRPDDAGGGGKYRWLSSSRHGGPSPGTPIHIARPATPRKTEMVYITEGPIKANISADRLGVVVVAVPGVSIHAGVLDVVRSLGAKRIAIAFDSDKHDKRHVLAAELALARELRDADIDVSVTTWPADAGKGLDDLLVAGGVPELRPFACPSERRIGKVIDMPREWIDARLPRPADLVTLDGARDMLAEALRRDLAPDAAPSVRVYELTTGAGKSITTARILQALTRGGDLGGRRVLVLMDTHEAIEELLSREDLADLRAVARVRCGRKGDADSPGYCKDKASGEDNISGRLAGRRQGTAAHYCKTTGEERCPFAEACAERGYLANLERCKTAPIVYAAKALFQADASELDGFNVVIVDEDLAREMFENVHITREDVADWSAAVARLRSEGRPTFTDGRKPPDPYAPGAALDRWLRLLEAAIVNGPRDPNTSSSVVSALREAAKVLRFDLMKTVEALDWFLPALDRLDRYPFERVLSEAGEWTIPLRATVDLLAAVRQDLAHPNGADSRMRICTWRDGASEKRTGGIELRVPKQAHREALAGKVVINLDATPRWPILRRIFPEARRVLLSLPERLHVTQISDPLLSVGYLDQILPRVNRLLDALTRDEERPVVFAPRKRLDPDDEREEAEAEGSDALDGWKAERQRRIEEEEVLSVSNPRAMFGHAGADTRGLNQFSEASAIVLVGHFLPNIGAIEAEMRAVRAAFPTGGTSSEAGPEEELIPFNWRATDGSGKARWTRRHPDPDVAGLVRVEAENYVRQAIGRGRAALRGPEDPPLRVYILAGYPLPGLKVDRLVTLAELEEENGLGSAPRGCPAHITKANEERHEDLRARVAAAGEDLKAKGGSVTARGVAREMGVGGGTITRIAEVLSGQELALTPPCTGQTPTKYIVGPCPVHPPVSASSPPVETCGNRDPGTRGNAGSTHSEGRCSRAFAEAEEATARALARLAELRASTAPPLPMPADLAARAQRMRGRVAAMLGRSVPDSARLIGPGTRFRGIRLRSAVGSTGGNAVAIRPP